MTTKNDYTLEEWKLLYAAAPMVGLAVASASPNGPFGVLKEMFAVGMSIADAIHKQTTNALINALVSDIQQRNTKMERPQSIRTPEEAKQAAINHMRQVADLLGRKSTPEEAEGFKRWLMDIAKRVAEASNEGGFFGFGGQRVSESEQAMLKSLGESLAVKI